MIGILASFLFVTVVSAAGLLPTCPGNDCNRAVTGTRRGPSATVQASSDCSAFMSTTSTVYATPDTM